MKKFAFTMQSVLNVKSSVEKQRKAELGACEARLREFRRELEEITDRRERTREEFRKALRDGISPAELAIYSMGFTAINGKIESQERKIETAEDERSRIQQSLIDVMQERKMLEKLKEKQLAEYKQLQKAEDAAMIDDFLSNKINTGLQSGQQADNGPA